MLLSTFSLVARDPEGLLGVAVTSRVLAVGAHCPHVKEGVAAVASQAYLNPYLAYDFLEASSLGDIEAVATATLAKDPGREWRQFLAVAPRGRPYAFTGTQTDPWAGHRVGADCAAAGNLLVGPETVDALVETFEASTQDLFAIRLVRALQAGQDAGGDRRGRQSAAILVKAREQAPFVDLRVDDHANPVLELARLLELLAPDFERSYQRAKSRKPTPVSEIKARQAQVRAQLESKEA